MDKLPTAGSLRRKLFLLCSALVITASLAFAVIGILQLRTLMRVAAETNESQSEAIKQRSEETLKRLGLEDMLNIVVSSAENVDGEFWTMRHDFTMLALQVQDILEHPEAYGERPVYAPDAANAGEYVLQLIFAEPETANDPATRALVGKLANLEPLMAEIVRGNTDYTRDCYISLTNGTTLAMDTVSEQKLDENGEVRPYDPRVRPWHVSAVEQGEFCFTLAVHSYFLELPEVEYGYPIYVDGELAAVLQGSTKLSVIQEFISDVGVGENGFSILVTGDGQLLYSPRETGELAMVDDTSRAILDAGGESFNALLRTALEQESGVGEAAIDGEEYYAAYARMPSLGWTLMTFVPRSELERPTEELLAEVDAISERAGEEYSRSFRRSSLLIVAVVALLIANASIAAVSLSGKITNPIHVMTQKIEDLTGDRFVFEMEDVYRTGDEIEVLANTFGKLSEQMESYLRNILAMTAEKERVGTELGLATRIQADMLPNTFPAFPERSEFDVFASMDPAKEVGGDFYDFFLVDDDHLALVVADVSGKGVPAALFMTISKTLLKNVAMHAVSPAEVLREVNAQLCENNRELMFVTVWLGIYEISTGTLTFADGGHEKPVLCHNGAWSFIEKHNGVALALMEPELLELEDDPPFVDETLHLQPGDVLFQYTDGVPEATNAHNELFGEERLLHALQEASSVEPSALLPYLRERIDAFVEGAPQFDDITMLAIRIPERGQEKQEV